MTLPGLPLTTGVKLSSLGLVVLEMFAPYGHGPERQLTADELAELAEVVQSEVADLWLEIPADLFPEATAVEASWTALGESRTTGEVWEAQLGFQRALTQLAAATNAWSIRPLGSGEALAAQVSPADRITALDHDVVTDLDGPGPDHWSCVVDYGRRPRLYGVRCGVRHRTEAAAARHWVRLAVADYDPRGFWPKPTADDARLEAHSAERMKWKLVWKRRWWGQPAYRGRRGYEYHSPDGRWIVRQVKIDKWRRRWKGYDCERESFLSLDWSDACIAREFIEGYGRPHRFCCCPESPVEERHRRQQH